MAELVKGKYKDYLYIELMPEERKNAAMQLCKQNMIREAFIRNGRCFLFAI